MVIKVLGPGCAKCNKTLELIQTLVEETGAAAEVEKVTDMMAIAGFGVFETPSVVVDGQVKIRGKVPSKKEVLAWLGR